MNLESHSLFCNIFVEKKTVADLGISEGGRGKSDEYADGVGVVT